MGQSVHPTNIGTQRAETRQAQPSLDLSLFIPGSITAAVAPDLLVARRVQ